MKPYTHLSLITLIWIPMLWGMDDTYRITYTPHTDTSSCSEQEKQVIDAFENILRKDMGESYDIADEIEISPQDLKPLLSRLVASIKKEHGDDYFSQIDSQPSEDSRVECSEKVLP